MLDKHYDPQIVEQGKYENWKTNGYFENGKDESKPVFSMVIPPPNVTGKLHLGHVMDTVPMDIISRYKRMKGFDVLWVPGCDHAGIATQAKVEEQLRKEGLSRYDLGREAFLKKAWEWKDKYAETIHKQWAALGLSLTYSKERFTLDEGLDNAVKKVFVTLYKEGLIYQGEKIINWDPELETALSNIEVVHQDDEGEFYYFYYDVVDSNEKLVVATTRPETMFGDTAVFCNPKDPRYTHLKGRCVINPANGEKLPIMFDRYVDISFGTGAMKCTPAHDPNDFNLAKKYGFPFIKVLDRRARMTSAAGKYEGLDRYECRKLLVEEIMKSGHLQKIEKIVHSVGHSERSGSVVEPMLSKQWFVKMKPLADKVLQTQEGKDAIKFIPTRFSKVLVRWMKNIDDWCISRQLWWGHRIPVYYLKDTNEILVSEGKPDMNLYYQDEDVLDTWFSSALWPFATLGWPDTSDPLFKRYFPTTLLVTGYDIIFFWVSRMVFQSLHFTHQVPFKEVLIHGLIRDEQGRKMSKSLGNGVDPMDVIAKYGADAMRYFITTNSTPGLDMRYNEEKVQAAEAYLNKIWNSTRYVEMVLGDNFKPSTIDKKKLAAPEKAIMDKLMRTIKKVTEKMDKYQFGQASNILYNFVYDDFCSSYLEESKIALQNGTEEEKEVIKNVLYKVNKDIILMIYPYAPFVTEEMYCSLPNSEPSIMEEAYPTYDKTFLSLSSSKKFDLLFKMIKDVRNYKSERGLSPNAKVRITIGPKEPYKGFITALKRFTFALNIEVIKEVSFKNFSYNDGYFLNVEEDIDKEELKAKLLKEKESLEKEVLRSEKMLSNPSFLSKAPKEKVETEKKKGEEYKARLKEVNEKLKTL